MINQGGTLSDLSGNERVRYVKEMFTQIAPRYDRMNRLMTFGQDINWRRKVIQYADLKPGSWVLDIGAGTGDLAAEARRQQPGCHVIAADFTPQMMLYGRERHAGNQLSWVTADARQLTFPDQSFNAVISGFLMRNLTDIPRSLAEQFRVLKPGGRIVALDTTPPRENLLAPFIRIHLHTIIPTLGRLIAGQGEAYQYLPDTTEHFLEPERLSARLVEAGFKHVGYLRLMFDTIAIHWGTR
jgi:demethylmenaquinone methyltransferase/2-methoxy-6-polyprenyl-1,4-benzoquinol methylase